MSPNFNALLNAVVVAIIYFVPLAVHTTGAHAAAGQGTAAAIRGAAAHGAASVAAADDATVSRSGTTAQQGLDGEVPTAAASGTSGVPLPSTSSVAGELNAADEPAVPPGLDIFALRDTDSGADAIEANDDGEVAHHGPSPPPFEDTREASAAPEDSSNASANVEPASPPSPRVVPKRVPLFRTESTTDCAQKTDDGEYDRIRARAMFYNRSIQHSPPPPPPFEDPRASSPAAEDSCFASPPNSPRVPTGIPLCRTQSETDCVEDMDDGELDRIRARARFYNRSTQHFPAPLPSPFEDGNESSPAAEDSSISALSAEPASPPRLRIPTGIPLFRTQSVVIDCDQEEEDDGEYDRIRARGGFYNRLLQRFPPPPTFEDPSESAHAADDSSIASPSAEPASPPSSPRVPTGIPLCRTESTAECVQEMDDSVYDLIRTMGILKELSERRCPTPPPFDQSEDFPTLPPDVIASVLPPLPVFTLEDLHSVPLVVPEDLFQSTRVAASTFLGDVGPATAPAGSSGPVADAGPSDDEVFWADVQARAARVRFTQKMISRPYRVRAHRITPEDCQKFGFWKDHLESAASNRRDGDDRNLPEPEDDNLPEPEVSSQPEAEDGNQLAQEEDEAIEPVDTNLLEAAARCAANKSKQLACLKALREKDLAKAPHLRENFVTGAELDTGFKLTRVREQRMLTGAQVAFVAGCFYPEESTDPGTPPPSPPPSPPSPSPSRLMWTPGETGVLKRTHDADDDHAHRPAKRARVQEEQDPLPSFAFLRRLRVESPPRPRRTHAATYPQLLLDDVDAAYVILFNTPNVTMQVANEPASTPIAGVAGPSRQPALKRPLTQTGASTSPAAPSGSTRTDTERRVRFARTPVICRLHRADGLPPPYMLGAEFGNAGGPATTSQATPRRSRDGRALPRRRGYKDWATVNEGDVEDSAVVNEGDEEEIDGA